MQMTYEQALRPGALMLFAARGGSGYMMRSEKRGGGYGSPNRRPPRRRKAGFFYIFFTLLLSVILWPIGMVMLWQRKVRMTAGTKLLISLLTLCLSVFLIVFTLTVPLDNVEFTAFQDKANDWLDKAAADVAVAGDTAMKKTTETWQAMADFAEAGTAYTTAYAADAIEAGVEAAGKARAAIEGLFHREGDAPAATKAPDDSEAPDASPAPAETDAPGETDAPLRTEAPLLPADSAAPAQSVAPVTSGEDIDLRLPEASPDAADAQPLEEGALHANGDFEPGEVDAPADASPEATTAAPLASATAVPLATATALPTEVPAAEATEKAEMVLVPVTEPPADDATEAPTEEPTEAPTEAPTPVPEPDAPYTVKPAGEATVYFFEGGSVGFHNGPNRHDMNGAPAHTLQQAFDLGKNPCKSCGMPGKDILDVAHIAWVDADNRIHTTDECADFKGQWKLMALEKALDAGYAACETCGADFYAEEIFPAPTVEPTPSPTPEPQAVTPAAALKPAGEAAVYYYDSSKGYHTSPDCANMKNAPAHTLAEAAASGKNACKHCKPPAASLIGLPALWLDENGLVHTTDECAAFAGKYRLVLRDDALAKGMSACPDCGAAEYLIPGTVLAE